MKLKLNFFLLSINNLLTLKIYLKSSPNFEEFFTKYLFLLIDFSSLSTFVIFFEKKYLYKSL